MRTNTLLCYLGLNMVLVIFFTSSYWTNLTAAKAAAGNTNSNLYMVVICKLHISVCQSRLQERVLTSFACGGGQSGRWRRWRRCASSGARCTLC